MLRLYVAGGCFLVLLVVGCGGPPAPRIASNVDTKPAPRILPRPKPVATPKTGGKPHHGRPHKPNKPPHKPTKPRYGGTILETAGWILPRGVRPTPNSWVITAVLNTHDCLSPSYIKARARHPEIVFGQKTAAVKFVLRVPRVQRRCFGRPVCVYIHLGRPLGRRQLLNGAANPPRPVKNSPEFLCIHGKLGYFRYARRRMAAAA